MKRDHVDLNLRPIIVFWEATKACKLVCKHCRAEAVEKPLPDELSTSEAMKFIEDLRHFGKPYPLLVVTGGDPLMRSDLFDLISYARSLGLRVALAPSVTPLLTPQVMTKLKELGVTVVSISLDGANPETHDRIRGVNGHFHHTVEAIKSLVSLGFKVQVNTAVTRLNIYELADLVKMLIDLGVHAWEVFFLIRVGRASAELDLEPTEYEDVVGFLYEASKYCLVVRTVEAPFFRRIVKTMKIKDRPRLGSLYLYLKNRLRELLEEPNCEPMAHVVGTRDGKGVIFVAHNGDVYPSGFMPFKLGNVRHVSLVEIYRRNSMLKLIKEASFKGKCGLCEYRDICGGSRARAYSLTGDPLESDPACIYIPRSCINELNI